MTFEELQIHRNSEKIILLEFDLPLVNDLLIADGEYAGLWFKVLTPEEVNISGFTPLNPNRNQYSYVDINSVKIIYENSIDNYTKTTSKADCITQEKSFYFNPATSIIYFHFDNFDPPLSRLIRLGVAEGFCSKLGTINKGRYNDIFYENRLNSIPSFSFKKDSTSFGVIEFQPVSYGLENSDGHFDDSSAFGITQISRQEARCYFGYDGLTKDDFELIHKSVIKDFNKTFTKYTIKGIDFRQVLNKSLPENTYDTTTYPNLDTDEDGELIPLAYGTVKNAPCTEIDTSAHTWKMCDTTYNGLVSGSVTAYKDGVAVSSGITYDYDNGTFTLSTYNDEEITADFSVDDGTGSVLENPLNVMKDLIVNWGSYAFLDTNFNTTEWNTETTNNSAFKIGKFIDDENKMTDIISDICKSSNVNFIPQKDGVYTARSYDPNRSISAVIQNWEWIDDPNETNPQDDFLSSVIIKYNRDVNNDEWSTYVDNTYKEQAIEDYSIENTRTIEADLSTEASAQLLATEIMTLSKDIVPIIERTIDMYRFDLKIMDFVYACHDRDLESTDFKVYEIVEIAYDLNKFQKKLKMRYISETDFANNWGIWDASNWDECIWAN